LYVAEDKNDRVQKFSPKGEWLATIGASGSGDGQFADPAGVVVDRAGDIWVSDYGHDRLQHFTADGRFVAAFGVRGSGAGQLVGRVVVCDYNNDRLQLFDPKTSRFTVVGRAGSAAGEFAKPWGVAVVNGQLFVSEYGNARVQRIPLP